MVSQNDRLREPSGSVRPIQLTVWRRGWGGLVSQELRGRGKGATLVKRWGHGLRNATGAQVDVTIV